jgi:hypothetical protein
MSLSILRNQYSDDEKNVISSSDWGNDRLVFNYRLTKSDPKDIGFANYDLLLEYVKARLHYEDVAAAEDRLGDKAIHDGYFSLDGLAEGKEEEEMAEERRQTLKDFFHSSKGHPVRK